LRSNHAYKILSDIKQRPRGCWWWGFLTDPIVQQGQIIVRFLVGKGKTDSSGKLECLEIKHIL
jgi:hypothetical protein